MIVVPSGDFSAILFWSGVVDSILFYFLIISDGHERLFGHMLVEMIVYLKLFDE